MSTSHTASNINLKIELRMKCFIQLARKSLIDNIESELSNTSNEEMRDALITKLTEVLKSDLRLVTSSGMVSTRTPPTEPVRVRGTRLRLKNIQDVNNYRKFCIAIADKLGYTSDFADSPFNTLPRNARIYEALKILFHEHNLTQMDLDKIVEECEDSSIA